MTQRIEALALQTPPLSVAAIHRQVVTLAAAQGMPAPCYRTVYNIIRRIAPALRTLAHHGSKAYHETFDLLYRREADAPNAIWQADHTLLDMLLTDAKGHARKPWLTVILDDYSRAVAGYMVAFEAPSALHTALALRQAIWRKPEPTWQVCGIPGVLYTDHGSDFTSQHLEQVCADLKIQAIFSLVGQPRGRGRIERFFNTVNQLLLARLPGYAPAGFATQVTPGLDLQGFAHAFEHFVLHEYHQTPHSATGIPPQARWSANGFLPQMPTSLDQLDLLLLTVAKPRQVHQDGIRFQALRYIDPTLAAYVGESITIRYDPAIWQKSASIIRTTFCAARSARSWPVKPSASRISPALATAASASCTRSLRRGGPWSTRCWSHPPCLLGARNRCHWLCPWLLPQSKIKRYAQD